MKNTKDPIENQIKARTVVPEPTAPAPTPVMQQSGTISLA
jgi:hypothetical protein